MAKAHREAESFDARRLTARTPSGHVAFAPVHTSQRYSSLLANVYLHRFDKMFYWQDGLSQWASACLVRYADDLVVMVKYQGYRIDEWIDAKLKGGLGLKINREKTKVVNLEKVDSFDFLGFTFRYDRDLYGSDKTYLNVMPSKKPLKKARDAVREKTESSKCYKPMLKVIEDLNTYLRGWSNSFEYGYLRREFRDLSHYTRSGM